MSAVGDQHVERLLLILKAGQDADAVYDPASRREGLARLAALAGSVGAPACLAEDVLLDGGLSGRLYRPFTSDAPQPALVYFHGGGFVAGGMDTHDGVCRRLALGSQRVVVSIAYRLAPEHIYPAAFDDAVRAIRSLACDALALGLDTKRLAVAGDSVGGGLALSVCLTLAQSMDVKVERLGLMCPILDLDRDSASRRRFGRGYFLEMETARRDFELYCPDPDVRAGAAASPLRAADLSGVPPTVIHTAEFDPFLDDGNDLAARLQALERRVDWVEHAKMIHYFYALPGLIPTAELALDQFARSLAADLR